MLPKISFNLSKAESQVIFTGKWLTKDLNEVIFALERFPCEEAGSGEISLKFDETFHADLAGAWLIVRWLKALEAKNLVVNKESLPTELQPLLEKDYQATSRVKVYSWEHTLVTIGQKTSEFFTNMGQLVTYFGEVVATFYDHLRHRRPLRWVSIVYHVYAVGLRAIPIVGLISFLIGAVLAYQGINQLNRFGASVYAVDFLAISLCREIAVLLTSVVIAGRSGSAFTAQIGTMALNQEIDAIRILGLNPISVLAIPRILALVIALPILVFLGVIFGLLGGMLITSLIIDMPYIQYWHATQKAISLSTFWVGMSKAPLFALIIGVVGCYRGMQVKGSAESVGVMTTRSVVESIFMVIVCDALMSIFFSIMDW